MFNSEKKIGIIGYGNMGSAIAGRIKDTYCVYVFDKEEDKIEGLPGILAADNPADLVRRSVVIILAVKPQDFDGVLGEIKGSIGDKLIISIAAGIKTGYIEEKLGRVRVIRVMPNLPAMIGKGANCLCKGSFAENKDLDFSRELFGSLGETFVFDEDMMDVVTAVSGSGPGYLYDFLEREDIDYRHIPEEKIRSFSDDFKKAAESAGLNKEEAGRLVEITVMGALAVISATGIVPSVLRDKVASKGGTTEAGLNVLHAGGTLAEAVKQAASRAKELSRR